MSKPWIREVEEVYLVLAATITPILLLGPYQPKQVGALQLSYGLATFAAVCLGWLVATRVLGEQKKLENEKQLLVEKAAKLDAECQRYYNELDPED